MFYFCVGLYDVFPDDLYVRMTVVGPMESPWSEATGRIRWASVCATP